MKRQTAGPMAASLTSAALRSGSWAILGALFSSRYL